MVRALVMSTVSVLPLGTSQDSLEASGFSADVPPRVTTLDGSVPVGQYTVHLAAEGYQPTAALQPVP